MRLVWNVFEPMISKSNYEKDSDLQSLRKYVFMWKALQVFTSINSFKQYIMRFTATIANLVHFAVGSSILGDVALAEKPNFSNTSSLSILIVSAISVISF